MRLTTTQNGPHQRSAILGPTQFYSDQKVQGHRPSTKALRLSPESAVGFWRKSRSLTAHRRDQRRIGWLYHGVWAAQHGDDLNGWQAEETLHSFAEAAEWLATKRSRAARCAGSQARGDCGRPLAELISKRRTAPSRCIGNGPVVDRVFSFEATLDAYRYFESRARFGKVVITHG